MDDDRKPDDPSPEEIRAMCDEIRRGWPQWRLDRYEEQFQAQLQVVWVDDLQVE